MELNIRPVLNHIDNTMETQKKPSATLSKHNIL